MSFRQRRCFLVLALLLGFSLSASHAQKKLTLSTKSQDAKHAYAETIKGIESFQQFQPLQQLAQSIVKADSNFAMGHMLVAAFSQPDARTKITEKALQLGAKASKGEQLYLEATSYAYTNNREKAIEIFTKLHKQYPGERRVCMMLGQLHQQLGQFKEAISYFEAANKIDASTPRAHSMIGDCYVLQEQYAKAREYYDAAISRVGPDASPFGPFFGKALSNIYEGQPDPAIAAVKEFHSRYSRNGSAEGFPDVWIWNFTGRVNLEFGRYDEALKCYETGYKSVPGSSIDSVNQKVWFGRVFHGKARTLAKMGRHGEAQQYADQIKMMIETGGKEGEQYWKAYHYLAGYLKLESGDYKAAAEHLEQSDQEDPFQKLLLAKANLKLGNKSYALDICKEIVKNTNNNFDRALAYPEAKKILASAGTF